jgi:hypothetical protein
VAPGALAAPTIAARSSAAQASAGSSLRPAAPPGTPITSKRIVRGPRPAFQPARNENLYGIIELNQGLVNMEGLRWK